MYGNCLSGGIIVAAGITHMIPERIISPFIQ